MDFGSILLMIALCVPVALYIARPLFERKSATSSQAEHDLSHWLAERDRTVNALQELDFDYTLGKIPEEDYPITRAWLIQSGSEILRKLDEIQSTVTGNQAARGLAEPIEAAIASRRMERTAVSTLATAGGNGHNALSDDSIETLIAARRRQRNGKAAGFCHKCGGAVQKSDQFCPKCGTHLKAAA